MSFLINELRKSEQRPFFEKECFEKESQVNFVSSVAGRTSDSNKNIFIGIVTVAIIFVGGFFYYNSLSDSLQKNINNADHLIFFQQNKTNSVSSVVLDIKSINKTGLPVDYKNISVKLKVKKIPSLADKKVEKTFPSAPEIKRINIKQQFVSDNIYQLLVQGYGAYQAENEEDAILYYSRVLDLEENNRDALLGLAAISVKNGQFGKAYDIYRMLLENDPLDSVSLSGFLEVQKSIDPAKNENVIKSLLNSETTSPRLLFFLGGLYASQQRWIEAQEMFFQAYTLNNRNADFSYNLAVSFDQLGQSVAALKFYRMALKLVKQQSALFKINQVVSRVNMLQEALKNEG